MEFYDRHMISRIVTNINAFITTEWLKTNLPTSVQYLNRKISKSLITIYTFFVLIAVTKVAIYFFLTVQNVLGKVSETKEPGAQIRFLNI